MSRKLSTLMVVLLSVVLVASMFGGVPTARAQAKTVVGLSFSDFQTPRWPVENQLMTDALTKLGYSVVSQQANQDNKTQNDQIANMITQGAKVIIVVANDATAQATAADDAAKQGVKIIAYDRLIYSPNIGAYITFGLTKVGNGQADGVLKALGFDPTNPGPTAKWTKDNPVQLVKLEGDPGDNNAQFFEAGQDETLKPFVDAGLVKVVARQSIQGWLLQNAVPAMENILTAQNNKVDAVIAANDNLGLGALQALTAQKLSIPVSGQDATAAGCNSIAKGGLTVTIMKDTRILAAEAVKLADEFVQGKTDPDLQTFTLASQSGKADMKGNIVAKFLPVQEVTKDNLFDTVVKSGFQSYDDVYKDVPNPPARPAAATMAATAAK